MLISKAVNFEDNGETHRKSHPKKFAVKEKAAYCFWHGSKETKNRV